MAETNQNKPRSRWRQVMFDVIFEANTRPGKWFDIILIISILISVSAIMLNSVESINAKYGRILVSAEFIFTFLFTIEYILRLICAGKPIKYATSFFGIVDLIAILPTYLSLVFFGPSYLMTIRILRVLRIFRVLKLINHIKEASLLRDALYLSRRKIFVFLCAVLTLVVIVGSLIYMIEGAENGFTSIPRSIYWAIVTLTTVGYGDISPATGLGQFLAAIVMIMGYSIIAVPTGIVTFELANAYKQESYQACPQCTAEDHDQDAKFCKHCGTEL